MAIVKFVPLVPKVAQMAETHIDGCISSKNVLTALNQYLTCYFKLVAIISIYRFVSLPLCTTFGPSGTNLRMVNSAGKFANDLNIGILDISLI